MMLAPLKSKQYELGAKHDGRRGWGVTGARCSRSTAARSTRTLRTTTSPTARCAARAELNGYVNVDNCVTASAAYTAGTYRRTDPSLEGNRLEGIPKWQASVGVTQKVPGVEGLSANAEVHYFDGLTADANNKYRLPSYCW